MRTNWRAWLVSTTCFALATGTGAKASANQAARLIYARSPEASACPDETALRNAVAARLGYDPFFPWAPRAVVVQIWRDGGRYRARLQLVDENGLAHGTRVLSSSQRTCAELFDTAALALSIAVDSMPKDTPAPADAAAALAPPVPPPTETAPAPAAPPPEVMATQPETPAASVEAAQVEAPSPVVLSLGAAALGVLGLEPNPTVGLAIFATAQRRSLSASLEVRSDAPSWTRNGDGPGRVAAWSYQAAIVPCVRGDAFSGCLIGGIGMLRGESSGITNSASASGLFVDAGARVGFEWPLSHRLSFCTHLDALFNLRRATLLINDAPAWTAPLLNATAGAGLAANFE